MFNLGPLELVAIFVVALLVFGPQKLPEIGRQVGRAVREFRKFQQSFQTEFRDVLEDPPPGPIVPSPSPGPGPRIDPATNTTLPPLENGDAAAAADTPAADTPAPAPPASDDGSREDSTPDTNPR